MKIKGILLGMSLLGSSIAGAAECRDYTDEQLEVINLAYSYGLPHNLEHSLSAIVVKESFVGKRIIRYNPNDPSTGITHIHYPTLQWLSGMNRWDAMVEAERLVGDDILSFSYSIKKLKSVKGKTLRERLSKYNGNSKTYGKEVLGIMKELKRCRVTPDWG